MIEIQKLNTIVLSYLLETARAVRHMALQGKGKGVLGEVPNRPEDLEVEIDRVGERIIKSLLLKHGVSAHILSECENEVVGAKKKAADLYVAIDPFDNTVLFFTGFRHTWYTALTFFNKQRKPLCGGIVDILDQKAWIFNGKKTFLLDILTKTKQAVSPCIRTKAQGPIVLASYVMSSQYSVKFFQNFRKMMKRMHPRALLYPFGGSHIYGYLADGRIDAYVMFDEPRSEIDPGFAIAKAVGCEVGSVDKSGNWHDYSFIPGKHRENVGFFLAACTKELRDDLIVHYKQQKP